MRPIPASISSAGLSPGRRRSLVRGLALRALGAAALAASVAALGGCAVTNSAESGLDGATTITLIRHAEKVTGPDAGTDPDLTDAGRARAAAYASRFEREGCFTLVLHTQFRRTRATAAPIAARCDARVGVVEATRDTDAHAREVAARVRALAPGERALYVGHSNTVPALIAALAPDAAPITIDEKTEYGRIFVVTIEKDGTATMQEEK